MENIQRSGRTGGRWFMDVRVASESYGRLMINPFYLISPSSVRVMTGSILVILMKVDNPDRRKV